MSKNEDIEKLESEVVEELAAAIGDLVDDHRGSSRVRDLQPPESIIQAMAVAAAQVLIAFERGYRMGD